MPETAPFAIGAEAKCTDGACGRLTQVVLDPISRQVTHVIVEPEHREGLGRLVPIDRVQPGADQVTLAYRLDEFQQLPGAESTHFLQGIEGFGGYASEQVLMWPYFGGNTTLPVVVDDLPAGEVAIRRGEAVHATDGQIGLVEGLVVDPATHAATHLVLQEGHLFRKRDIAIPMSLVQQLRQDGVSLSVTKQEVEALPDIEFDRPK
jgi:sporulation protein YlmC with PRC-barrel domain